MAKIPSNQGQIGQIHVAIYHDTGVFYYSERLTRYQFQTLMLNLVSSVDCHKVDQIMTGDAVEK
ncbi:hypothetical protein JP09_000380 [Dehalogenimonas etheniformans]|uniref:Uncharacterized protein n=1 Tax=Dehalogenimonas etheniformans TaxID=1536648 RepID=A0A2P5PA51_9CHLR|nr:hypothetical protein JP09_000380 [Dehalogenimonas etheniformans]